MDFERRPQLRRVFDLDLDPLRIVGELELLLGSRIVAGEDLLVLDEIQACPRAIMALRYFYEELPQLHVAAAGSLMEFALQDMAFPVGRVQSITVRPLSFAEFLFAIGETTSAQLLAGEPQPLPSTVHEKLLDCLARYMLVGGMPAAVETFAATGSIRAAHEILLDLITSYRDDFGKYAPRADKRGLNSVLAHVSAAIGGQIKYARLATEVSSRTVQRDLELLEMAHLITRVRATSGASLPLAASASPKRFKTIMLDTGMAQVLANRSPMAVTASNHLLDAWQGQIAEQFAGQEFLAAGRPELFYWAREIRGSSAEVDYLLDCGDRIRPVEVKADMSGRLRSMHMLLDTYRDAGPGYVLSSRPFAELPNRRLVFVPLYFARSIARRAD